MSRRNKLLKYVPLSELNKFIKVELGYSEGGTNWATGAKNERGYEIYFRIVTVEDNMEQFQMFGSESFKVFLKGAKRFNQKTFDELVSLYRADFNLKCQNHVEVLAARNNLKLAA